MAIEFDGTNQYVDCGDVEAIDGTTELTVVALFWRDEIVGSGSSQQGNVDCLSVLVYDGDTQAWSSSPDGSLNDTNWHHVAFTFVANDSQGLKPYVDGINVNSASTIGCDSIYATSNPFIIAAAIDSTAYLAGLVDEVCVWNIALTADEIATLAKSKRRLALSVRGDHIVGYWRLDGPNGAVATGANSGTPYNDPVYRGSILTYPE